MHTRPSGSSFASFAAPANTRYERILPQGIVPPAAETDIALALGWAHDQQLPATVRGGGHSYAGYSTTDGLLLHLGMLKAGTVDTAAGTATVQAGMRNRDVLRLLASTRVARRSPRRPERETGDGLVRQLPGPEPDGLAARLLRRQLRTSGHGETHVRSGWTAPVRTGHRARAAVRGRIVTRRWLAAARTCQVN